MQVEREGRYTGERGREYFAWQQQGGRNTGAFNGHLWRPVVAGSKAILDFGCGGGYLLESFAAERRAGVEVNPAARERAEDAGIEVYERIEEVPGRFDTIVSSHALEHVERPTEVLRALREKLAGSESKLALLLPMEDWRAGSNRRHRDDDINMHLYGWTPQLLGNLLRVSGYSVREIRIVTHAWPPRSGALWSIHPFVFHGAAFLWSVLRRQRQLFAVASMARS